MTVAMETKMGKRIAFQGEPGAYSHIACKKFAEGYEPMACATFEAAFAAVQSGDADRAMIPIENSLAGRVSDIHHLLPDSGLHIVAEHFLEISHNLIGAPGASLSDIKVARSHAMALGQVRDFLREANIQPQVSGDTAGAAKTLAARPEKEIAVVASDLAAEIYGLDILKASIEDADHNTTRFLEMASEPDDAVADGSLIVTSFVFQVRNIPAALYKAMGGFATNAVNMTKLESYQQDGSFRATMFYADIEGHPEDEAVRLALEELSFFSTSLKILGVYKAARAQR